MTKFLFIFVLLISNMSRAKAGETSSKCPGEAGYYFTNDKQRNPRAGGFVSNEAAVEDSDAVTIEPEAAVCGSSSVSGRVTIFGKAVIDNSRLEGTEKILVGGSAKISNGVQITGKVEITNQAALRGNIIVEGSGKGIRIFGDAVLSNSSSVKEMHILEQAQIFGNAELVGSVTVQGTSRIFGKSRLSGTTVVAGNSEIQGFTRRSSGVLTDAKLDEPDYEAIAAAKALEAKRAQDRADAEAAEAASAEALRSAHLQKIKRYRDEVEATFNQLPEQKLEFTGDCHFVIKSAEEVIHYELSRNSNSFKRNRTPAVSGFSVREKANSEFEVSLESEVQDFNEENPKGKWFYRGFTSGETTARSFVEKLEFLWNNCR